MADQSTMTAIDENATLDGMESAVDDIMANRAASSDAEVAVEKTSDSEKLASDNDKPVTQRGDEDTTANEKGTVSASDGENTGDGDTAKDDSVKDESDTDDSDTEDSDWRDEAKAEAASHGIDEKVLSEMTSREELDRTLSLFNRQLDAEREKVLKGEKESEEKVQEKVESKEERDSSDPKDGQFEIGLDPEVYDEELVGELSRMRDHYEDRIAAIEERFTNADSAAEEKEFDRSVDSLEFSKLFGKSGEETDTELARRGELFERVRIEQIVLSNLGRNAGDHNALVERVARSIFPEDFEKKTIRNHTRKLTRQSAKIMGSGNSSPPDTQESWLEEVLRDYEELEAQSG